MAKLFEKFYDKRSSTSCFVELSEAARRRESSAVPHEIINTIFVIGSVRHNAWTVKLGYFGHHVNLDSARSVRALKHVRLGRTPKGSTSFTTNQVVTYIRDNGRDDDQQSKARILEFEALAKRLGWPELMAMRRHDEAQPGFQDKKLVA